MIGALRHPVVAGALAAIAAAALVLLGRTADALDPLDRIERFTLDLRFALRGPTPPGAETVIVAFDDATDAADPTLFSRRAGWVRLLDALHRAQPLAVGIDAYFTDAEVLLNEDLARDVGEYVAARPELDGTNDDGHAADRLLARVHDELSGDDALEAAIRRSGDVVLSVHLGVRGDAAGRAAELASATYGQAVPGARMPSDARSVVTSLPRFARAAAAQGMITVFADSDQTVRELLMARVHDGRVVAPLSVQLAARARGVGRAGVAYLAEPPTVVIGERSVPVGPAHTMVLNYRGPAGTFPTYSAIDVVTGKVGAAQLRGKIVLVGYTHLAHDTARTPFQPLFPGVELHATAVDNLLRGDPIRRAPAGADLAASLLAGLLVVAWFLPRVRLPPAARIAGAAAVVAIALIVVHALFAARGVWLSATGPLFAGLAAAAVSLAASYTAEGRERRRVRSAFAHYLSDDVIQELLRDPSRLALGGARADVSVLFSDVRGFTTLAEQTPPEELVRFLNGYLSPMTRAVLDSGGYLDKYVGDAIMAVFGAPVAAADHADRALRAALEMHRRLALLRPTLAPPFAGRLEIGVGINSGEAVVGNMGSAERFDYTAIGDAVNLASRLEGLTKLYGVFCLVGDDVRRRAGAGFRFREIDLVRVKGRATPVPVHELVAGPGRVLVDLVDVDVFGRALAAYRAGDFTAARAGFTAFRIANPSDEVVAVHLARLDELGDVPVALWDGVYAATTK